MKSRRIKRKSALHRRPTNQITNKPNRSFRLIKRLKKRPVRKFRKINTTTCSAKMDKSKATLRSSTNKQNEAQPSTSRQAVPLGTPASTSSSNKSPRQKKPFTKFKDNQYRKAEKEKQKSNLRRKPKRSPTEPNSGQILSRKILRTIRKRRSNLSHHLNKLTSSRLKNDEDLQNIVSIVPNISVPRSEPESVENTNLDDDCICIEPQTEVITIDDETLTTEPHRSGNYNEVKQFKHYESIGSMRMNNFQDSSSLKMFTSTPKLKLHGDNVHKVPIYGSNSPLLDSTMTSTSSEIADCTLVENRNRNRDNDIVIIDDMESVHDETTNERVTDQKKRDDSVIFVSERVINTARFSTAPSYIPLETPAEESHFRINYNTVPIPKVKRTRNDLFNSKEQKQLKLYNENAYNPNGDATTPQTKKRMVIIDGSNVAYHHSRNKEFSVKGLKICLDYFEKMGHEVKALVPQFRLQKQKSSDPVELEKLHKDGKIVFTPCKNLPGKSSTSYDDRLVLQLAAELDAAVVSNDNYRDLIHENPAFKKIIENRVIGYTWCNDLFILPKDPYGRWGPTLSTILNRT